MCILKGNYRIWLKYIFVWCRKKNSFQKKCELRLKKIKSIIENITSHHQHRLVDIVAFAGANVKASSGASASKRTQAGAQETDSCKWDPKLCHQFITKLL